MLSLKAQKPSPSTLLLLPSREEKLGKLLREVFGEVVGEVLGGLEKDLEIFY